MSFFSWLWVSGMTITVRKPKRIGDQRQADAGVAGRAFDDRCRRAAARRFFTASLDDEQRGAVLDRLARIQELGLAENLAAGRLRGALSLISGVLPIASMMPLQNCIVANSTAIDLRGLSP